MKKIVMLRNIIFAIFLIFIACGLKAVEPVALLNGLAIYKIGEGKPALLMPYPHASTYYSMSECPLVTMLNEQGFAVYTFDPPGIFRSTREATVTLNEMLSCSNEVLNFFSIGDSVLLVGHSQGGFCALAFTIENPSKVNRMLLIGTPSGWPIVLKSSMHKQFPWYSTTRWKMMVWGTRKMLGWSNLKIHKKLDRLVYQISFVDQKYVEPIPIEKADRKKPDPVRAKWMVNLRKYNYDYSNRLNEINIPVMVTVGRHDPQTPVSMNQELTSNIPNSSLIIFEKSGHSPFVEETEAFSGAIESWLK